MNRPLVGWDLATWRITQSDPGLSANVVAVAEIAGWVEKSHLLPRIELLLETYPVLKMGVKDSLPIELDFLPNFKPEQYVYDESVNILELAANLSRMQIGYDECLWRLHVVHRNSKTYLVTAIHHAIADGNTAMVFLQTLLDEPQFPEIQSGQKSNDIDVYEELKQGAGKIVNRLTRDPVGLAKDLSQMLQSVNRIISLDISDRISVEDSNLTAKLYKLDKRQLQNFVKGKGISNHDVMAGVIVSSLQKYFEVDKLGRKNLVVNIPVAMNLDDAVSNKLVVARIDFEIEPQPVTAVMQYSREKLRNWRKEPGLSIAAHLINASALIPIDLITKAIKNADATISTLVGGATSKRMFGFEVKAVWPLVPPIGAGLNFTSVAMGEYVYAGITIDNAKISDLDRWQRVFEQTYFEVFGTKIFEQIFE